MSSAITFGAIGAAAGVYSASQSGKGGGGGGGSTETKLADPRMNELLYGTDENNIGGLLGDSRDWYNANKSGMNDQMRQGLNQQWATLNDPSVMAGYRQRQNLGSGLLGAPVMGNPFSDGRVSLMSGHGGMGGMGGMGGGSANLGLGGGASFGGAAPGQQYPSYQPVYGGNQAPITANTGPFAAPPPSAPAPVAAPAPAPNPNMMMTPTGYEQFYQGPGGNMYRIGQDGQYHDVYTSDFGTGNGGA